MFKFCKKCVAIRQFKVGNITDNWRDFGLIRFCDVCGAEE
tara:strand:+ start:4037 stop:4156 length:120 start_codon:yes stop_codon:yes gene_type:complete